LQPFLIKKKLVKGRVVFFGKTWWGILNHWTLHKASKILIRSSAWTNGRTDRQTMISHTVLCKQQQTKE